MNLSEDFYQMEPPTKDLIEEFKYKVKPTQTHKEFLKVIETYWKENEKFMTKHNLEAGRRARKALLQLYELSKQRRLEIADVIYREGEQNESTT
jgi:hypothetical protein